MSVAGALHMRRFPLRRSGSDIRATQRSQSLGFSSPICIHVIVGALVSVGYASACDTLPKYWKSSLGRPWAGLRWWFPIFMRGFIK